MSTRIANRRPPQLRLNGAEAACNPCRSRKVACDHERPACSRCRSKNRTAECIYAANATRKHKAMSDPPPATMPEQTLSLTSRLPKRHRANARMGHTSSLEETQPNLVSAHNSPYHDTPQNEDADAGRKISFAQLPRPIRETCLSVLRALPGQADEQMVYLDGDFEAKGWVHLATHRIIQWFNVFFAESSARNERDTMERLAQIISNNTAKPLRGPYPDWESWMSCFVGENTRWESIGLIWTHMESVSDIFDALIPRKLVRSKNNTSANTAVIHLDYCLQLTRHFTDESDLLAELYRRRAILGTLVHGEHGLATWEAHGQAVNYMIYSDLHVADGSSLYKPNAWSENNRRLAASIFVFDKLDVMINGRLPLIGHRYYTAGLPLDIRDEDLIADSDMLDRAVNSLDERGWNTQGGLYPATVSRARCMMALIRDEVIEMTMGEAIPSLSYLLDLKERQHAMMAEFPASIKYDPDLEAAPSDVQSTYVKVITHLEHLQNLFFIDRLLIRFGYTERDGLLETSLALISIALRFWTRKDEFADKVMQRSFEWIMLSYGAPAAGILCQDLLGAGHHRKDHGISRTTIIQQLTLLSAFFDWVRPSAPNAKLCANCKGIIQQVLDQCLNTVAGTSSTVDFTWGFGDQPDFSFELMDTFDWLRGTEFE